MYRDDWVAAWNLQKKFLDVRNDDEYWQSFYSEYAEIVAKNPEDEFLVDMLRAVWHELRRQARRAGENANTGV